MKTLTAQQIRLIFALGHELPFMRAELSMARIISTYPKKKESRHPVINFALNHAETAIIEWLVLRFSEAFQILNRATVQFFGKDLFVQEGRSYKSKDHRNIVYLLRMRDEYIAHHVANIHQDSGTLKKVKGEYGTVLCFLNGVMDLIEEIIDELEFHKVYEGVDDLAAGVTVVKEFTEYDLGLLIEAANALVDAK